MYSYFPERSQPLILRPFGRSSHRANFYFYELVFLKQTDSIYFNRSYNTRSGSLFFETLDAGAANRKFRVVDLYVNFYDD
jgi:hypothetical protein